MGMDDRREDEGPKNSMGRKSKKEQVMGVKDQEKQARERNK